MAQSKNKRENNLIFNLKKVLSHIASSIRRKKEIIVKRILMIKLKYFLQKYYLKLLT